MLCDWFYFSLLEGRFLPVNIKVKSLIEVTASQGTSVLYQSQNLFHQILVTFYTSHLALNAYIKNAYIKKQSFGKSCERLPRQV